MQKLPNDLDTAFRDYVIAASDKARAEQAFARSAESLTGMLDRRKKPLEYPVRVKVRDRTFEFTADESGLHFKEIKEGDE